MRFKKYVIKFYNNDELICEYRCKKLANKKYKFVWKKAHKLLKCIKGCNKFKIIAFR